MVIVTYNSEAEIGTCLDAVQLTGAPVVVVDNDSGDGTCAKVHQRGVRLIANTENRGFAAAVNQGVRALDTPYVLLLNPDAQLQSGLEALADCCRRDRVAAACGQLIDEAGRPQTGFAVRSLPSAAALICEVLLINRLWPHNPVNWHYRCLDFDFSAEHQVEQPAGAFLMIRRDVWQELGGFDEKFYPLWFEDVDFCWRAKDKGYGILYTPLAVAKHTGGHSLVKISLENRQLYWYGSVLRFAAKHYRASTVRIVCLAAGLGLTLRMLAGGLPIAAYGKAMAIAGRNLLRPAVE